MELGYFLRDADDAVRAEHIDDLVGELRNPMCRFEETDGVIGVAVFLEESRPLALRTAIGALAPGTGITGRPRLRHSRTSRNPGSLIAGVPASVAIAIDSPEDSRSASFEAISCSLCSW